MPSDTLFLVLAFAVDLLLTGDYSLTVLGSAGNQGGRWSEQFSVPWIPRLGIRFDLGIDGLSLLLIALTGLLGLMAVACSWRDISRKVGFFHLNLMWNLGGVIGVFLATDLFLFFFFWEMMLVPMFFLIALWGHNIPGGRGRLYAATKFFIFTQASGLVMLVRFWRWCSCITGQPPADVQLRRAAAHADECAHGILDHARILRCLCSEAAGGTTAFLVAGCARTGTDGRFSDPRGRAAQDGGLRPAALSVAAVPAGSGRIRIGGDVAGGVWHRLRRDLGFRTERHQTPRGLHLDQHMGFILVGVFAGTEKRCRGVVIQMLAHGISAGGLFILCGELYERLHTRDLTEMGGLWSRFSYLPPIALFFVVASLGLPGLGNFLGEFLILLGTFQAHPAVAVVAASGLILSAVYSLILMQRAFHGKPKSDTRLADLNRREIATLGTLAALLIWLGLYPQPILDVSRAPMRALQRLYAPPAPAVGVDAESTPAVGGAP